MLGVYNPQTLAWANFKISDPPMSKDSPKNSATAASERVIALAPNLLELVYDLGVEEILVGRSQFATFPPESQKLPAVGSYYRPDLEKIIALRPTLCLAITDGTPIHVLERLETLGIEVFRSNPKSFADLHTLILQLGERLQRKTQAEKLAKQLNSKLQALTQQVQQAQKEHASPKVLFQLQTNPCIVAGQATFIDQLIKLAGGTNVVTSPNYPRLSSEEILALQPDIILAVGMTGPNQESGKIKATWDGYDLPATRNNRVYELNPDIFNRISLRSLEALEELIQLFFKANPIVKTNTTSFNSKVHQLYNPSPLLTTSLSNHVY